MNFLCIPFSKPLMTNYLNGKFEFKYSSNILVTRRNKEDYMAFLILKNEDFNKNVINISKKLSKFLKSNIFLVNSYDKLNFFLIAKKILTRFLKLNLFQNMT